MRSNAASNVPCSASSKCMHTEWGLLLHSAEQQSATEGSLYAWEQLNLLCCCISSNHAGAELLMHVSSENTHQCKCSSMEIRGICLWNTSFFFCYGMRRYALMRWCFPDLGYGMMVKSRRKQGLKVVERGCLKVTFNFQWPKRWKFLVYFSVRFKKLIN